MASHNSNQLLSVGDVPVSLNPTPSLNSIAQLNSSVPLNSTEASSSISYNEHGSSLVATSLESTTSTMEEPPTKKRKHRNQMKEKGLRGSAKHCVYGVCKSDSRYPEKAPTGMHFVPFAKPAKEISDYTNKFLVGQMKERNDKCKRWAHACGRPGFGVSNVKKDTYICSLHFIGGKGNVWMLGQLRLPLKTYIHICLICQTLKGTQLTI